MAAIGRRGGRVSRRELSPQAARAMVSVREARRAYRRFYAQCFWSYAPDLKILVRLHLVQPIDLQALKAAWLAALDGAETFVRIRPPEEVG